VSAGFATKGKNGTASGAARVTRAALRRRVRTDPGVATPAVADPLEVRERTSELDETVTDKRGAFFGGAKKNQRRAARRGDAAGIGRGALAPSAADAEAAFARYAELRAKNGGAALHPRFARPAPARARERARLGAGAHAGDENAGDENPGDDDATRGAEDDDRLATRASDYQFVLGFEGVRRQQRERAARAEAIAAAARRRKRRACFNPAASKRRRKHQAEMEVAIEAPLTIVYEPLFAEDVAEDVAFAGATPVSAPDASAPPVAAAAVAAALESDWESDDDVPLAALVPRNAPAADPTLAEIAASERRVAAAKRAAKFGAPAAVKTEAAGFKTEAAGFEPSVMRKVATAASSVLSRFIGAKPAARGRGLPRALAEHAEEAAHAEVRRRPRRRGVGPRRLPTGREQQRLESGVTSRGSEGKKKKKALFVPLSPLVALEFAFSNVEKARVYLSTHRVCINLIKRGACRSRERTVG
jgi:GNAT superfamily N-acetyltransferase